MGEGSGGRSGDRVAKKKRGPDGLKGSREVGEGEAGLGLLLLGVPPRPGWVAGR